jgi:hypothetical protein
VGLLGFVLFVGVLTERSRSLWASADEGRAATNTALRLVRSAAPSNSACCVHAAQVNFGLMRANRCRERRA